MREGWKGEQLLGELKTFIVGMQYYEAEVNPGERVNLEREPDNPHDANSIRVENPDFLPVGHIPRRISGWLAPLLDGGKVRAEGAVGSEPPPPFTNRAPLRLMLHLCSKGRHILEANTEPSTELEALHEIIRRAYADVEPYKDPELVAGLGERLAVLGTRDTLPETRLLLALFPGRAALVRQRQIEHVAAMLKEEIAGIDVGEPLHHHNITVFPLMGARGKGCYTLLAQAIKSGQALVEDVDEEGDVPNLRVVNDSERPLLIVEGEVLRGAKQDRVVNITVIVAAKTSFTLPVSCVERGRWDYVSKHFRPERFVPPRVRAAAMQDMQSGEGEYHPNQSRIWREVDSVLEDVGADSATATIADAFKASQKRLKEYRNRISLPKEAAGFLVAKGDALVGMDLFDSPKTMRKFWRRLSEAYFVEALRDTKETRPAKKRTARKLLRHISENAKVSAQQLGSGLRLHVESEKLVGSAVWSGEQLCHLSAFAAPEGAIDGPGPEAC